jgi:hypothetical protein
MAAKTYPNPPQPQTQQAQDRHQPDERGEAQLAVRELTAWHPGLLVGQFSALFSEALTTLPSEHQLDARKTGIPLRQSRSSTAATLRYAPERTSPRDRRQSHHLDHRRSSETDLDRDRELLQDEDRAVTISNHAPRHPRCCICPTAAPVMWMLVAPSLILKPASRARGWSGKAQQPSHAEYAPIPQNQTRNPVRPDERKRSRPILGSVFSCKRDQAGPCIGHGKLVSDGLNCDSYFSSNSLSATWLSMLNH